MKKIVEDFIKFAEERGVKLTATQSKDGEHFEDFYGYATIGQSRNAVTANCPRCGQRLFDLVKWTNDGVEFTVCTPTYCEHCGQRLDWSEHNGG